MTSNEKQFTGFPARTQFTPVPNVFISTVLPQIDDLAELKTILHVFAALYRKKGYPRFVTEQELLKDRGLVRSLKQAAKPPEEALRHTLEAASRRRILLHLSLDRDGIKEELYFLNTEAERQVVTKIESGELELPGLRVSEQPVPVTGELPDIFTLYEQNIGMLTPMIAEELQEAERLYPESWIRDAIKEAVNQNIRKKSYILAILERWSAEGRGRGTHQRDPKKTDPDKYIKGRYGHMVRR